MPKPKQSSRSSRSRPARGRPNRYYEALLGDRVTVQEVPALPPDLAPTSSSKQREPGIVRAVANALRRDMEHEPRALDVPSKTDGYSMSDITVMTGTSNDLINDHMRLAHVTVAKRGGKNHRYSLKEVGATLRSFIATCPTTKTVEQCRKALERLPKSD